MDQENDTVETDASEPDFKLKFVKMLAVATVGFLASEGAKKAFDGIVAKMTNSETTDDSVE